MSSGAGEEEKKKRYRSESKVLKEFLVPPDEPKLKDPGTLSERAGSSCEGSEQREHEQVLCARMADAHTRAHVEERASDAPVSGV